MAAPFAYFGYLAIDQAAFGGIHRENDLLAVDLKSLGYFTLNGKYGTLSDVPARWRELDGKRIALEGFMYDGNSAGRTHDFEFVYNIQKCCFNGPPFVQERVFARISAGSTVPFYREECRLIGKLHVAVENPTGDLVSSVYSIDVEGIEPLKSNSWIVASAAGIVLAGAFGIRAISSRAQSNGN